MLQGAALTEIMVFWKFYMKTNLNSYRNSSILHYTDFKAAEHILTYGYRNEDLQKKICDIVIKTRLFGISLAAVWM